MTNRIMVPKGKTITHSFDLWGVIIDTGKMGPVKLRAYDMAAPALGLPDAEHAQAREDYEALCRGEAYARANKGPIIARVEGRIAEAEGSGLISVDYDAAFPDVLMQDGVAALEKVLSLGYHPIIFSSGDAPWVRRNLPEGMGLHLGNIYSASKPDGKSVPEAFDRVYAVEMGLDHQVVSHTEDDLGALVAAMASGHFSPQNLVFVARNAKVSAEHVREAGIGQYTGDLREIDYASMAEYGQD
ncbi:MAG: HAD family hydrolase [Nanoarchaeota archaeon]